MIIDFGLPENSFTQHFTTQFSRDEVLTAQEKHHINGLSEKRLLHFCTGRLCAKTALAQLGTLNGEILIGPNKMPVWPGGFTGSISHADGLAGAMAARRADLLSVGLDIEKTGRVQPGMWDMLFTPAEQEFLCSLSDVEQVFHTTLYFSMKESFYKLQYPLTHFAMWFTDVEISQSNGQFRLRVKKEFDGKKLLPEWTGLHFARYQDYLISICFIR